MSKKKADDCGEIRATRIALVDGSGKERIVMQLEKDHPSITLFGLKGKAQVRLLINGEDGNNAELMLLSPDGQVIGRFCAIGHPTHAATLLLGRGRKQIVATTNPSGMPPMLDLIDEFGITLAHLPTPILKTTVNTKAKPKSKKAVASKVSKKK